MDDPAHGVVVTLIDLGLARMDAGDGCGGEMIHWTPFDKEIFMGEGNFSLVCVTNVKSIIQATINLISIA